MYNEKYGRVDKVQRVNLEGSQPDKKIESGKKTDSGKGMESEDSRDKRRKYVCRKRPESHERPGYR